MVGITEGHCKWQSLCDINDVFHWLVGEQLRLVVQPILAKSCQKMSLLRC